MELMPSRISTRPRRRQQKRSRGSFLVLAVFALTAVTTLASMSLMRSSNESLLADRYRANQQAFHLAEAGVEATLAWFDQLSAPPPWVDARDPILDQSCSPQASATLPTGQYTVCFDPDDNNVNVDDDSYQLTVTGRTTAGVQTSRVISLTLRLTSFARWDTFMHTTGTVWMNRAEGPVHTNDRLQVSGSDEFPAQFTEPVSAVNPAMRCYKDGVGLGCAPPYGTRSDGLKPQFDKGVTLGANPIPLPLNLERLEARAQVTVSGPTSARVEGATLLVTNAGKGWVDYPVAIDRLALFVKNTTDPVTGDVIAPGTLTFKGGELDGQLTLGTEGSIWITNSATYKCNSRSPTDDPDCQNAAGEVVYNDDMLGLVALNDVQISQTAPYNLWVDAAFMAVTGTIRVEAGTPLKGSYYRNGSEIMYTAGPIYWSSGGYPWGDDLYDKRLLATAPPFFPTTGKLETVLWDEQ